MAQGKGRSTHKRTNPVAKYAKLYNRATVQQDRKKESKRGGRKHKQDYRHGE